MNDNGIVQFDKIEIKNISIGKKFEEEQPEIPNQRYICNARFIC